jgi:ABC-type phosphate transport system substrate-binding protein
VEHVIAGTYKFVRPFLFVWPKGQPLSGVAQDYVNYVMSPDGQRELAQLGLIPEKHQ